VDERLDKTLRDFKQGGVAPLSVHEAQPDADTIVLKRFNPKTLTISFVNAELPLLKPCAQNCERLTRKTTISQINGRLEIGLISLA
jgi:hypothetical protein